MQLLDLPAEILTHIGGSLRNIEDFTSLASTCRTLHTILPETTSPNTILKLCDRSSPTFFSHHFLIAATSRRLSQCVLGNPSLTEQLVKAFQSGVDGLYEFCLDHSGITLAEIRKWHLARFSIINPLSDIIDKMAGKQWYDTPNFWDGGVSEALTIHTEADRAALQIIIYGELFEGSFQPFLEPDSGALPYFGPNVRLEYVKYCIPDWVCASYPGFEVLPTGPYAEKPDSQDDEPSAADQSAMHHILFCGRWRRMWRAVLRQVGPDFWDEEAQEERTKAEQGWIGAGDRQEWKMETAPQRRHLLWWNAAVQTGGLEGAEAVATLDAAGKLQPGPLERLTALRHKIEALSDEQVLGIGSLTVGVWTKDIVSEVPDLGHEVAVAMRRMWPGTEYCTHCERWGHVIEKHDPEDLVDADENDGDEHIEDAE